MARNAIAGLGLVWLLSAAVSTAYAQSDFLGHLGHVVDNANILTLEEEQNLTRELEARTHSADQRVVVVAVKSLNGKSIEQYAFELGQHWHIDDWPGEVGAILLIADNERQVRIEFGPPVRGSMIDVRSSQMVQRVILPAFRAGQFEIGIEAGLNELFAMLDTGVAQSSDEARHLSEFILDKRMLIPLVLLICLGVIVLCSANRAPCRRAG